MRKAVAFSNLSPIIAHVAELPGGQIPGDRGESKENEKTDEEMAIIGKDFVFENDGKLLYYSERCASLIAHQL